MGGRVLAAGDRPGLQRVSIQAAGVFLPLWFDPGSALEWLARVLPRIEPALNVVLTATMAGFLLCFRNTRAAKSG